MKKLFIFLPIFLLLLTATDATAEDTCQKTLRETGSCPTNICSYNRVQVNAGNRAIGISCTLKPCSEIAVDDCPLDDCQLMIGCEGAEVCYDPVDRDPPRCGEIGEPAQSVPCCEGLVRRCGYEFASGSCDLIGKNSIYSVPVCLPCGNGICNQFEDACNCPEDCGTGTYKGFDVDKAPEEEEEIEEDDKKEDKKKDKFKDFRGLLEQPED